MKYNIKKSEKTPAYLQLYQLIRTDIIQGLYPYGAKLPSKRLIADEVGVSTVTIEHTYALLCDEGYLEARERSGFFVIFRPTDGFAAVENTNHTGFHTANHIFPSTYTFPFSVLAKTMRKVLSDYGEALLEKAPNAGCIELRTAICQYLARNRGIQADIHQIIIGSGAEYLYGLIIELLGRERIFGIEAPSYQKIEQVYCASAVTYERLPLTDDGIDSMALAKTHASVLHTTPYRSFPSGVSTTASKRHEYIQWANDLSRYIVEDDFESEFSVTSKPTETLFALAEQDNIIYMNTFSKTISPALRIGYMVLPHHLVMPFETKLGFYSCTVPTFEQLVLAALINNGDFERHINRVRRKKRKEEKGE